MRLLRMLLLPLALFGLGSLHASAADPWLVLPGGEGPGKGKNIVLVSGDEEYRSEEALPQLAKILAKRHGFSCTVLFAIDRKDDSINPNQRDNIPGLEALDKADLMILFTRYRDLPDDQMKHIVDYVESGRPVVGMRTATHAFKLSSKTYARFSSGSKEPGWDGGFGRQVLGEDWITHLGPNHKTSTHGVPVKGEENSPLLRGVKEGDLWAASGEYAVRLPMQADCKPLVLGQVLDAEKPDAKPVEGKQNDPLMPVAWTKVSTRDDGKKTRAFCTTMGAGPDLVSEGVRRLIVNAAYWAVGMEEKIPEKANVDLVGDYKPNEFNFNGFKKGMLPEDFAK